MSLATTLHTSKYCSPESAPSGKGFLEGIRLSGPLFPLNIIMRLEPYTRTMYLLIATCGKRTVDTNVPHTIILKVFAYNRTYQGSGVCSAQRNTSGRHVARNSRRRSDSPAEGGPEGDVRNTRLAPVGPPPSYGPPAAKKMRLVCKYSPGNHFTY